MSKWSEILLSPQFVGGAVGAAGNIVSTLATNASNRAMQREANEFNRQMWLEQTEYNTPANQMARLKQAGLNPNLANGEPNQAGAPPEYHSSKNEAPQVDPMMIANAMLLKSQQEANDAVAEKEQALADKTNTENELLKKDLGTYDERYEIDKQTKTIINQLNQAKANQTEEQTRELKEYFEEWKKFAPQREQEWDLFLKQLSKNLDLTDKQIAYVSNLKDKVFKELQFITKEFEVWFSPSKWGGKSLYQANVEFAIDNAFEQNTAIQLQNRINKLYAELFDDPEFKEAFKGAGKRAMNVKDSFASEISAYLNSFTEPFKGIFQVNLSLWNNQNGTASKQGSYTVPTPKGGSRGPVFNAPTTTFQ